MVENENDWMEEIAVQLSPLRATQRLIIKALTIVEKEKIKPMEENLMLVEQVRKEAAGKEIARLEGDKKELEEALDAKLRCPLHHKPVIYCKDCVNGKSSESKEADS